MLIITIRTDNPEAEIGLYDDDGLGYSPDDVKSQLAYETWHAHRTLAETIHTKLQAMLAKHGKNFPDIGGIIVYKGPGSFTGLRIGITVANTLAYGLGVPIVGIAGESWQYSGLQLLRDEFSDGQVMPEYGSDAHITQQKK